MPIKMQVIGADALVKIGALNSARKQKFMNDLFTAADRFSLDAVAIAKRDYLSGPRPEKLGAKTGRLRANVVRQVNQSGDVTEVKIGDNVAYAAIHERGGVTHPRVTDRMRKFSWAMFFKTKDEKFKRLALTNKTHLTIKIPERPFLRPSLQDAMPSFQDNIRRILQKISFVEA